MIKEDIQELERLVQLQQVSMVDKNAALQFVKTYVNKGAVFCLTCDPAVRSLFSQLKNWYELNKTKLKTIKPL